MLGASPFQTVSVIRARELGYHVVTCDNVPTNPGHKFAHESFNVSTTDRKAVLELARRIRPDGVVCYASDPAAPTAAYVAEELELPGHPFESVRILCNKDLYRKFLVGNGFHTPVSFAFSSLDEAIERLGELKMPVIVKPVDSSGSRGVSRVDEPAQMAEAIEHAAKYTRAGRFVVEEFVTPIGYPISGDGFSWKGELLFRYFGNDHFDLASDHPYMPFGLSFPYLGPESVQVEIQSEIQRLLTLLGMQSGTYNFDIRLGENDETYLMEVGPRSGGGRIPELLKLATGIDMIDLVLQSAMGEDCSGIKSKPVEGFWSLFYVHSDRSGTFKQLRVDPDFQRRHVVDSQIYRSAGDSVASFKGSDGILGTMFLRFDSGEQMLSMMGNMHEMVHVELESHG